MSINDIKSKKTFFYFAHRGAPWLKEENTIDWNRQIENAMLKVSAILTLWVLVDKVNAE